MNKLKVRLGNFFERAEYFYMVLGFGYLGIYSVQVLVEPPADIYQGLELVSDAIYWLFAIDVVMRLIYIGR
ncbi:MAG: hypothetical protein VW952_01810, partial [Aquiluna sp.]